MHLLAELTDHSIGLPAQPRRTLYQLRKASRAVLVDHDNRLAILAVRKDHYHKLPGGGFENDENVLDALRREVREEVGAEIEITGEVGCIIEYRAEFEQLQISYCYRARVVGKLTQPSFTLVEQADQFALEWHTLDEALALLRRDEPTSYIGKFIRVRDLLFLEQARSSES